jgi:hypothetical protein
MGKVVGFVAAAALIVVGVVTVNPVIANAGIALAIGQTANLAASVLRKKPKLNRSTQDRLHATIDPGTPRKVVFGETAMATDVRYQAFTGTDKEYYWQIVCTSSHETEQLELWLDDKQAWTLAAA